MMGMVVGSRWKPGNSPKMKPNFPSVAGNRLLVEVKMKQLTPVSGSSADVLVAGHKTQDVRANCFLALCVWSEFR